MNGLAPNITQYNRESAEKVLNELLINAYGTSDKFNLADWTQEQANSLIIRDSKNNIGIKLDSGFNSSETIQAKINPSIKYTLGIADENGNVLCDLGNLQSSSGSSNAETCLKGLKVSILGDSISTLKGYIPNGYAIYYPNGNVTKYEDTWWGKLIIKGNMTLCRNASWSGSNVSGDSQGSTATAGCSDKRIADLTGTDGSKPDIILIYIGTNDWANGSQHKVGSFGPNDALPSEGTINDIAPAYALMLYKIRKTYPDARVYCLTCLEGRHSTSGSSYPIVNNYKESIHQVNHAIIECAHIFGAKVIDLETCGIHFWNISKYTVDGHLHPNYAGTTIIADTCYQQLVSDFRYKS